MMGCFGKDIALKSLLPNIFKIMDRNDINSESFNKEAKESDATSTQTENPNMEEQAGKETAEDELEENETLGVEIELEDIKEETPVIEISEVEKLKEELGQAKDKYIRLYSEFENFRRRTAKEKIDLIKTANEDMMLAVLPILDDFERAKKAIEAKNEEGADKEGFDLIYNKLLKILEQKGLQPMADLVGKDFDSEIQEAITSIPAPEDGLKGKVVDVVEKGYSLKEKVIRFAKVIIGA